MGLKEKLSSGSAAKVRVEGQVVPETSRCVRCGMCSYYCPIAIDVRRHAWLDTPVIDSHCLTCGECIARCPRAVLRFERSILFRTAAQAITHFKGNQKARQNV